MASQNDLDQMLNSCEIGDCDDEDIEVIKNSQEGRRIFNKKNSQEVVFLAYEAISVDDNVDKQVNLNLK